MTDDRDSRVPSPVGSRGSVPELLDLLFKLALDVHRWLVRHRYVLRHNRSALGLALNYLILVAVPIFPVIIYLQWLVILEDGDGDYLDYKAVIFLVVSAYLFTLSLIYLLTPFSGFSSALEMAIWGAVVLAATTLYKVFP